MSVPCPRFPCFSGSLSVLPLTRFNNMVPTITDVTPTQGYTLDLRFSNGENRLFDMSPYIHIGLFRDLQDQEMFATARKSFDTVEWDNGADIDPESLYTESIPVTNGQ